MAKIDNSPVYFDCNSTTPVEDEVVDAIAHYMRVEYGNAGSRTHRFGAVAAKAVKEAREQVASMVDADWDNIVFTSGATESNNLAILGLAESAVLDQKKHVIATQIEHKAVLEPLEELERKGFEVTLIPPGPGGAIDPHAVDNALRPDTFLVSVMHVNNETGVIQPLRAIGAVLEDHPAVFHTDAAQGFGKELSEPRTTRLDLISVSAHKIFGPKGIGALVVKRNPRTDRLRPLQFGGGQEHGLRPGTIPVALAVGFGVAAKLAARDHQERQTHCKTIREQLLRQLAPLNPIIHGDQARALPHVLNISFGELDAEAVIIALKDLVAISTGSACTSASYRPSHVLNAMGVTPALTASATRWSWCHQTKQIKWAQILSRIQQLS